MAQSFGIQAFLFRYIEWFYRDLEILNI
jgi:hypothetical protein